MERLITGGDWYSITDSLEKLDTSRGTLYDRINDQLLTTKKEGKNRFVWIDEDAIKLFGNSKSTSNEQTDYTNELREQITYFKDRVDKLEQEMSVMKERHDGIVLHMNQNYQKLVEQQERPFWMKWFGRKNNA